VDENGTEHKYWSCSWLNRELCEKYGRNLDFTNMCYAVKSLGLKESPKSGNRYHAAKIIHMKRFAWETQQK
jgi:hypothetical protein